MPDLVQTTISEGIATLTLNRPEARNALSPDLIDRMNEAVLEIARQAQDQGPGGPTKQVETESQFFNAASPRLWH